jgi:hypothetical protein
MDLSRRQSRFRFGNQHAIRRPASSAINNAAERALRGVALGRKAWLFAGSDRDSERAAFMYARIGTAKLNDIDPQAWLADVLARIADIPQNRLYELHTWNRRHPAELVKAAEPRSPTGCFLFTCKRNENLKGRFPPE